MTVPPALPLPMELSPGPQVPRGPLHLAPLY